METWRRREVYPAERVASGSLQNIGPLETWGYVAGATSVRGLEDVPNIKHISRCLKSKHKGVRGERGH